MFRQNHLWLLVASLALAGCLGEESKKVAVGPAQPPTIAEESPETPDPSQPNANTNSPQNETPFPEVEIDTSPVDFGDIPPAPEAYSGQDQDPDTPIPPEVQRTLKSYSDEDIPEQIKLLQYPQANVRVQAIGRFTYIGEEYVPQVVQALRGALKDPNVHVRRAAANAISHHGPKAKDALPELAALIHSKDTDEVDAVMNALARIGPDAAPLVGQLAELLKQQDYENKGDVIDTLGWIGPAAKPTAPLLVASLDDWLHNDNAGDALARIGAHDELLRAMSHEKSSVRSTAAESAGLLETHSPEMVTRLIKMATTDEYEYARAYAAHTLGKVRPTTKEITLAIGQATKDEDSDVRRGAARGLGETDPKFDEAVPLLLAIAKDEDKWVRESAAAALGTFEASPESRLTVLLDQLQETANFSYSAPAAALKKSCDEFYPLLQAIAEDVEQDEARRGIALLSVMELMENSEFNTDERKLQVGKLAQSLVGEEQPATVRGAAAVVMRSYSPDKDSENPPQVPALLAGLGDGKHVEIRRLCARSIAYNEIAEGIPALIKTLEVENESLRDTVIDALADFEDVATDAIPALLKIAKNPKATNRTDAIFAIGRIGTQHEITMPALTALLSDESEYVRNQAVTAIADVVVTNDLDASSVIPKIVARMQKEEEGYEKRSYISALGEMGPKSAGTVNHLIPLLDDEYVNDDTAMALGAIGPDAKAAAPKLIAAAQNWKESQSDAIRALGKIKANGAEFAAIAPKLMEDLDLRDVTLETLAEYGAGAADAAPAVAALLESDEERERTRAAQTLAAMGEGAKGQLEKLKAVAAGDENRWVRQQAYDALLAIAPDDPQVLELSLAEVPEMRESQLDDIIEKLGDGAPNVVEVGLKSDKPLIRAAAIRLLPKIKDIEEAKPAFLAALDDEDARVRNQAAIQLSELGHSSPKMAVAFVHGLDGDTDWQVRNAIRQQGRAVIEPLIDVIIAAEKEDYIRQEAVELLSEVAYEARIPKDRLQAALEGDDVQVKSWAAVALAMADPKSDQAVGQLIKMIQGADYTRRLAALRAIPHLRFKDDKIPPELGTVLVEALAEDDEDIIYAVDNAVSYRDLDEGQLPAMLKLLENEETRDGALRVLAEGALSDESLIDPIAAGFQSEDEQTRIYATSALREFGEAGLKKMLNIFVDADMPDHARLAAGNGLVMMSHESEDFEGKDAFRDPLVALLSAEQEGLRQRAAVILAMWGHEWAPLQKDVLSSLTADDYQIRHGIFRIANSRADDLKSAEDALLAMVASDDEEARNSAANLLGRIGEPSPKASEALIAAMMKAEEDYERSTLANPLLDHPSGRAALLKFAETATDDEKAKIVGLYVELYNEQLENVAGEIALAKAGLASDHASLQHASAKALARLNPESSEPVPVLLKHLVDEDGDLDYYTTNALAELGPQAKDAVPELIKLLDDEDSAYSVLHTLSRIGPAAAPALPKARELLKSKEHFSEAIQLIASIGPAAKDAAPDLIAQLDRPDYMRMVVEALVKIETPSEQLLPALYKFLRDPYRRYEAVAAMGGLGELGKEAVPVLIRATTLGDTELTVKAAQALGQLEDGAAEAADELAQLLKHEDDEVRDEAASAVARIAAQPDKCVPALVVALDDENESVRRSAVYALGEFGEPAAPATPELIKLLSDEQLSGNAARSLGSIGPAAQEAIPELIAFIEENKEKNKQRYHWPSYTAIEALGKMGEAAKPAVPLLVQMHASENETIKRASATALWKIDPAAAKQAGAEEPTEEDEE